MKLEWLCRLTPEQLHDLLDRLDCKEAARPKVIRAVKEVLGETSPATTVSPNVIKKVDRLVQHLVGLVEDFQTQTPEPEVLRHVGELVTDALRRVQEIVALPASETAPPDVPATAADDR
jgi:hypothetical protein